MTPADAIHADLANVMRIAFPNRDFFGSVGPETRVFGDLGLASIDLIVFAEKLEAFYGRRLPFAAFLGDLRKCGADDLELGTLVAFLQQYVR